MPIVSTKKPAGYLTTPATVAPTPLEPIQISAPEYDGTVVDQRWTSKANLLTHIEGSSWTVTYYSQVLGKNSPLSGQQLSLDAPYQSYKKICDLELKVTSALSTSQESDSKEMQVNGSALIYPFMVPNEGDMFVADIGEGKLGLFRITATVKKSIFKAACYEINYTLDTDNEEKRIDLEHKVVDTLQFNKDYLNFGKDPLLIKSDHQALLDLKKAYEVLLYQYFKKFFSNEFKTLIVPSQGGRTVYDHFLVKFLLDTIDNWDCQDVSFLRALVVDDDPVMESDNLWTALQHRDADYLQTGFTQIGLVSTRAFTANPRLNGIRYTGIQSVIYPTDPVVTVDGELIGTAKVLEIHSLAASPHKGGQLNAMVRSINIQAVAGHWANLYPVTRDNCYVLSRSFYENSPDQSYLESLTWKFLNNEAPDPQVLIEASKSQAHWGILEQFYYVPLILFFIKTLIVEGR